MLCVYGGGVMLDRRASIQYNAESLKQGSKRLNSITKTIHFAHLGILFIYVINRLRLTPAITGHAGCKPYWLDGFFLNFDKDLKKGNCELYF